jgi:acyl carrier protein
MAYLRDDFVRRALAEYLDLKPSDIADGAELGRDLGLEPLDLVLIVFRLEEFADADAEFSISDLEGVVSVGDFEKIVRAWARDASADDEEEEPIDPSRSGTHVVGTTKVRAAR